MSRRPPVIFDGGFASLWQRLCSLFQQKKLLLSTETAAYLQVRLAEAEAWYRREGRKVVVVISSYHDTKALARCLAALLETVKPTMRDIIIVDDASSDGLHLSFLRGLVEQNQGVRVAFGKTHLGFAGNVNRGLAECPDGDAVVMTSDVEPLGFWLEAMQQAVYHGEAAIACPRLLSPSGTIQSGGGIRDACAPDRFDYWCRTKPADYLPATSDAFALYAPGAVMYLRREALPRLGAFDPTYPPGLAEVDYCLRAWENGLRTVYAGASWLLLHREPSFVGEPADAQRANSAVAFWQKRTGFFRRQVCDPVSGRPRVIFVTQHSGIGGGHRVILTRANHLARHGYAVEFWNLAGTPDWFPLDPNIPVRIFGSYYELVRALATEHAIKIATWWETAEPVWLASLLTGIPVYLVQDIESSYYDGVDSGRAAEVLARYRPEFNYIANCEWLKHELEQRFQVDAINLGLGYQSDRFRPVAAARRDRTILVAVRGERLKNFDYSRTLLKRLQRHQMKVIAFGSEGKGLLADLGDVEFHDRPDDETLCRLYNETWFFLQTSIHEGFSLPPIEAMACGCIPIVTAAGGNEEYIEDGRNCIEIPHGNVDGAVTKILPAIDDPAFRQRLIGGGAETALRYNWNESHRRLEAFIDAIVARPEYGVRVRDKNILAQK